MSTQAIVIQVIYPASAASSFNIDYYINTHIPLVKSRWGPQGLQSCAVFVGSGGSEGSEGSGYHVQAVMVWNSLEAWLNVKHKEEVMDDIKNFTDVSPYRWVGEVIDRGDIHQGEEEK